MPLTPKARAGSYGKKKSFSSRTALAHSLRLGETTLAKNSRGLAHAKSHRASFSSEQLLNSQKTKATNIFLMHSRSYTRAESGFAPFGSERVNSRKYLKRRYEHAALKKRFFLWDFSTTRKNIFPPLTHLSFRHSKKERPIQCSMQCTRAFR